jgi:hypothetical protein
MIKQIIAFIAGCVLSFAMIAFVLYLLEHWGFLMNDFLGLYIMLVEWALAIGAIVVAGMVLTNIISVAFGDEE